MHQKLHIICGKSDLQAFSNTSFPIVRGENAVILAFWSSQTQCGTCTCPLMLDLQLLLNLRLLLQCSFHCSPLPVYWTKDILVETPNPAPQNAPHKVLPIPVKGSSLAYQPSVILDLSFSHIYLVVSQQIPMFKIHLGFSSLFPFFYQYSSELHVLSLGLLQEASGFLPCFYPCPSLVEMIFDTIQYVRACRYSAKKCTSLKQYAEQNPESIHSL